ncbi:MAG: T9SS type A sorting domain-containing protein [Saprospiraceae bacterium]|nr:T9SS type A sorting domain-containing protein [Saprospiraceae bacterium]
MKQVFTTLVLGFLLCQVAMAQATFKIEPNPSSINVAPTVLDAAAKSKVINLTGGNKNMRWERTIIELPANISSLVCDKNLCWASGVSTKDFLLTPGDSATMDAHFLNPLELTASAIVHIKVSNLADPTNDFVNGVYLYNQSTSTSNPLPAADVKLFPNPVVDQFTLSNDQDVAAVRVYSLDGRQVAAYNASADHQYNLATQAAGTYIVSLLAADGRTFQAIQVNKQ